MAKKKPHPSALDHWLVSALLLLLVLALLSIFALALDAETATAHMLRQTEHSIFRVVCQKTAEKSYDGTAWMAPSSLRYITAAHIVKGGCLSLTLHQHGRDPIVVQVSKEGNENKDIALLQPLDGQDFPYAPALPLNTTLPDLGDRVWVYGYALDLTAPTVVSGVISSTQLRIFPDYPSRRITVDAGILFGHSGSPALNDRGDVVGMAVEAISADAHLSFLIPASDLASFIGMKN